MNERQALLRAVRENPDDDTPRLVFADWLQEHGEEARAEFIRLQCHLHQMERGGWGQVDEDDWAAILARTENILEANREAWFGALFRRSGLSNRIATWGGFERGFVGGVSIWGASAFQTNWNRIFWASPLHNLSLSSVEEVGEALRHPSAAHLRKLSLHSCELSEADLHALASPVRFPRLQSLILRPLGGRLNPEVEQRLRERFGSGFGFEIEQTHFDWPPWE